ncbi:hypothetical protein D3C86_1854620 [compost metagenome]
MRPLAAYWRPWVWTLITSGQVASMACNWRWLASAMTSRETPCALKIVTAPVGTSSSSSTKRAPLSFSPSTTCLLCTISCRTNTGAPCLTRARSTISIARTTPAQKPRG